MFLIKFVIAAAAAAGVVMSAGASAAQSPDVPPSGTVAVQKKAGKRKPAPADDRIWLGLGAKGGGGADAGVGAQLALNFLRSDGMLFRFQHHALIVDKRGPEDASVEDDSDCFFFECIFEAFSNGFDPELASVTETGVLVGRRLEPDSGWFGAIGVARQSYSDDRKTDSRDEVGVGVPVILGWSTALKHSGVGFEFDVSGSAGKVSQQIGAQISLTFGGRSR